MKRTALFLCASRALAACAPRPDSIAAEKGKILALEARLQSC